MPKASPLTIKDRIEINDRMAAYAWALDTGDGSTAAALANSPGSADANANGSR
jgi:hypothetical protein